MIHEWLNALHLIAGVLWTGGLLALALVSVVFRSAGTGAKEGLRTLAVAVQKWNRCITSPAMILLWVAGIWMIVSHGQFPHAWLLIKMVVVLVLSALHGLLSGNLRRLASGQPAKDFALVRNAGTVIVIGVIIISIMAIIRPF
ncbi:CopD family protein [Rahnella bonaserana]|uniref:CopD family protein n=1 Tax=Rahnella bonaserana TaxID=2816248 RepID=UPI0024C3CF9E|nr:CopD family protein [Rahnella bonaserana]WHZ38812.1 CopD family protein [Rahnella bonaserana]